MWPWMCVCICSYRYAKSQKQQQQQLTTATTRAIQQQHRCSHCAHELVALAAITIKHACKYWIIKKGEKQKEYKTKQETWKKCKTKVKQERKVCFVVPKL